MLNVLVLFLTNPSYAELTDECGKDNPPLVQYLSWADTTDSHQLTGSQLETGLVYTLEIRARLGALQHAWNQQVTVDGSGDLSAGITVPAQAFLDALAEDYVTDLAVQLVGRDVQGRVFASYKAPAAFLAWPDGAQGGAVVWDEAAMAQEAPLGIVDDALRAEFSGSSATRVLAPIAFDQTPELDLAVEGG